MNIGFVIILAGRPAAPASDGRPWWLVWVAAVVALVALIALVLRWADRPVRPRRPRGESRIAPGPHRRSPDRVPRPDSATHSAHAVRAGPAALVGAAAPPPDRLGPGDPPGRPGDPRDAAAAAPTGATSTAEQDRRALVLLCVEMADRLRDENPALHSRLRRGLSEAGVVAVEPDGEPFDRSRHDAVGQEPAPSPDRDRRVASTEAVGYVDRGVVVRRPEVVVYVQEATHEH